MEVYELISDIVGFFHADALYAYTSPVSVYTCIKTHLKNSFTHYVICKRELN